MFLFWGRRPFVRAAAAVANPPQPSLERARPTSCGARGASSQGRSVCVVVHQPLPEVLEQADLLWLLVDGRTAYYGDLHRNLVTHFQAVAYRDRGVPFHTLSQALNFVTLRPEVWGRAGPGGRGRAGMHEKRRGLRGSPRGGWAGGWRRLPKRLGAVTVRYKCH